MKTDREIFERLMAEAEDFIPYENGPLYECAGDYIRGWLAALRWVLDKD